MGKLASLLERLSSAQPSPVHREVFKAPNFTDDGNIEDFIQQCQEVAMANEWSETAALVHICTHLKDGARINPTNQPLELAAGLTIGIFTSIDQQDIT